MTVKQRISKYFSSGDLVPLGVLLVALALAWNTVLAMQRNYRLEQRYKQLTAEVELLEIENQNTKYMIEYTKSDDYRELAARSKLGKAFNGESLIHINGKNISAKEPEPQKQVIAKKESTGWRSNLQAWWHFFARQD